MGAALLMLQQGTTYGHTKNTLPNELNNTTFISTEETDEEEFVVEAAQGALLEVKLGELAQVNGSAQLVKDFGKTMSAEHAKGYEDLKALAIQKKITIPEGLSKKGNHKLEKLSKKTGHEFDKEYMDYMVEDHHDDVESFEEAADELKDADVKAWAAKTLPMLKQHLAMAKAGYKAVK